MELKKNKFGESQSQKKKLKKPNKAKQTVTFKPVKEQDLMVGDLILSKIRLQTKPGEMVLYTAKAYYGVILFHKRENNKDVFYILFEDSEFRRVPKKSIGKPSSLIQITETIKKNALPPEIKTKISGDKDSSYYNEINENMDGRQALRPYGDGVAGFKSHRRPPRELALVSPTSSVHPPGS
jgi:hypothetical protein